MFFIRGRRLWRARKPKTTPIRDDWRRGVMLVVHHTADQFSQAEKRIRKETAHLRAMQHFHQEVRGWNDIGYNYLIFPSGRVYEGRGFGVRGAHVEGHNTGSCGISFVGNFTDREPTPAAVAAFYKLKTRLREKGAKQDGLLPHCALGATACPAKVQDALNIRTR